MCTSRGCLKSSVVLVCKVLQRLQMNGKYAQMHLYKEYEAKFASMVMFSGHAVPRIYRGVSSSSCLTGLSWQWLSPVIASIVVPH